MKKKEKKKKNDQVIPGRRSILRKYIESENTQDMKKIQNNVVLSSAESTRQKKWLGRQTEKRS